jgi:hypothetical protein
MRYPITKYRPELLTADCADITERNTPLQLGHAASVSASSALSAVLSFRPAFVRLAPICCVASLPGWIIPEQGGAKGRHPRLRSESLGGWRPSRRGGRSGSAAVPRLSRLAAERPRAALREFGVVGWIALEPAHSKV